MPPRRTEPVFDPERALDRIREEGAKQIAFVEAAFDRMSDRLDSIQRDVRQGNIDRDSMGREIAEVKRQILDTREEMQRYKGEQTQAAARGAAEGASSQSIEPAVAHALSTQAKKLNRPQWYALAGVGLLWLTTFFDKAPAVFKGLERLWQAIAGLSK